MDSADTLRTRWITEAQRLTLYRRQRVCVHCDPTRTLDEHNAHTAGTWEHAQRALVDA